MPTGNRVAATISINLFFGTGYMPPKTGVLLNNTMDDFSTKPGRPNEFGLVGATANAIAPNKRPLSSMSPTFVETSKGLMIEGSPGGSYIISMVILGTLNYVDGMSAADIVNYPRYHHQYLPDVVDYEAERADRAAKSASFLPWDTCSRCPGGAGAICRSLLGISPAAKWQRRPIRAARASAWSTRRRSE